MKHSTLDPKVTPIWETVVISHAGTLMLTLGVIVFCIAIAWLIMRDDAFHR